LPATRHVIELGERTFFEDPNWIVAFGTAFGFEFQSPQMFGAVARALTSSYGMSAHDVEFFSVHVTADEDHTGAIVRVLDGYMRSEDDRRAVRAAALTYAEAYHRMLSTYEAFA
jgi:pyrroloquinoline quinone (PQQ) biosynthesis protein C